MTMSSTRKHHQSTKFDSSSKRPNDVSATLEPPQPRPRPSNSAAAPNNNYFPLDETAQEALEDAAQLRHRRKGEGWPPPPPPSKHSATTGNSTTLSLAPAPQLRQGDPSNYNNADSFPIATGSTYPTTSNLNSSNVNDIAWDNMVKAAISVADSVGANRVGPAPAVVQRRRSAVEGKQSGSVGSSASSSRVASRRRSEKSMREPNLQPSNYMDKNGNSNNAPPHHGGGGGGGGDPRWASQGPNATSSTSTALSVTYNKFKGMMRSRSVSRSRTSKSKSRSDHEKYHTKPQRSSSEKQQDDSPRKSMHQHRRSNKSASATTPGTHYSSLYSSTNASNSGEPPSQRVSIPNKANPVQSTNTTIPFNNVQNVEEGEHLDADVPTPHSSPCNNAATDKDSGTLPASLIEPLAMRPPAPANYASAYSVVANDSPTRNGHRSSYAGSVCSSLVDMSTTSDCASACPSAFLSLAASESSGMGPTSVCPSVNNSNGINVITNSPADYLIIHPNTGSATVVNLPWEDDSSGRKVPCKYSGPVAIVPHGEGRLFLAEGNASLAFTGRWENGMLVTPLRNDDEVKSAMMGSIGNSTHNDEHKIKKKKKKKKKSSSRRRNSSSPVASDYANLTQEAEQASRPKSTHTISKDTPSHDDANARSNSLQPPTISTYALGAIARSPHEMIIHRSNEKAIHSASLLKKYDRAFLKRSNGVWACAVLADREFQPTNVPDTRAHWHTQAEIDTESTKLEECMLFVINEDGATKIVRKRHWGKFIRRSKTATGDKDNVSAGGEGREESRSLYLGSSMQTL